MSSFAGTQRNLLVAIRGTGPITNFFFDKTITTSSKKKLDFDLKVCSLFYYGGLENLAVRFHLGHNGSKHLAPSQAVQTV